MLYKIAHIADVHIRGLARHTEYRRVFESFFADIQAQKVDAVFVGGDIFHTKTIGITPEYIDLMRWWLTQMAEVAPVHIILGNHDGNLVNAQRQDAVSPIVNTLKHPRVFLYKQSDVYQIFPQVNLCVFSLFDEEGWGRVKPCSNSYNIACYHGSVRGARTEGDWELTDGISVEFFNAYDLVFLGDIHKQQFLGTRTYGAEVKPWIAYPGSVVQQNFAEDLEHGYLLWSIDPEQKNHDVEFRHLPNPNPFVTIEWRGNVAKTVLEAKGNSLGTRFRVRSNISLVQNDVSALTSELKQKFDALEVVFKIDDSINRDVISTGTMSIARDDLRNTEVLLEMMKEYYESEEVTEEQWEKIDDLIKNYMKSVQAMDDCLRNVKWSIKKLEFDNMYAYGTKNVINFEKLHGITGVFGPNRTGKSSIIGAILYSLFNASDRGSLKNLFLINNRKDFCFSRITVDVGGVEYRFERQTVKHENKKGPFGVTNLNAFRVNDDGSLKELNGDQRFDTDKVIRGLVGTVDDFLMTSVSTQDYLKQFIHEGPTVRKQIISRFLDLDVFEKIHDVVSRDVNATKAKLKNLSVQSWDELIKTKEGKISEFTGQIQKFETSIAELRDLSTELQEKIVQLKKSQLVTQHDVTKSQNNLKTISDRLLKTDSQIKNVEKEICEKQAKIENYRELQNAFDISTIQAQLEQQRHLEKAYFQLKHLYDKEANELQVQERSVLKLLEVPCGNQFPQCKFIRDSHQDNQTIVAKRTKVDEISTELDEATLRIAGVSIAELEEKIKKIEKLVKTNQQYEIEISKKQLELSLLRTEQNSLQQSLKAAQVELESFQEDFKKSEAGLLQETQQKFSQYARQIQEYEQAKLAAAHARGREESDIEKLQDEFSRFTVLQEEFRLFELISNAFSKRGIPNRVIHNQLPIINNEIAKILHGIVNFTVELETDTESNSLDMFLNYGDSKRVIELGSGMEKVISALAIRIALSIVSTLPKADIMIIDEGFSDLDENSIEICNRLIRSFKKYFKNILIITHIDGIKEVIDNMIEITKQEHDSRVVHE